MATRKMLLDDFALRGNTYEDFKRDLQMMADATEVAVTNGKVVELLSLDRVQKHYADYKNKTLFYILNDELVDGFINFGEQLKLAMVANEDIGQELLQEMTNTSGLLLYFDKEKYLVSQRALKTLSQRAGISGPLTVSRHNLTRDLHLADSLISKEEPLSFVYRHADGVNKIFTALSGKYVLNRQDIIIKAFEHPDFPFKDCTVKDYYIDNFITELRCNMPSNDDTFVPGIMVKNSDVGESSLLVRTIVSLGDSYVITSETALSHDKNCFTFDNLLTKTFAEAWKAFNADSFIQQVNAFKNLKRGVLDYSAVDLSTAAGRETNQTKMEEIIEELASHMFGDLLSVKLLRIVTTELCNEIIASQQYTYYDIALMFIKAPEIIAEKDEYTKVSLRRELKHLPDYLEKVI